KAQHRGGKGITGLTTRENDFVKDLIMTSTHDHLMFFTSLGKVYKLKAYQIPEASRTAKGTPVVNFLNISQDERVSSVIPVGQPEEGETSYLTQITKFGRIKRTLLSEFRSNRANGLIAINLKDGDSLVDVKQTRGSDELIVVTKFGKSIRFREEDVRAMGRDTSGVRAILLEEGDEVVSMSIVDPEKSLLTVTENGFGKRTPLEEYKLQIRGGKGIMTVDRLKIDRTGNVVGAEIVDEDDEIMLINSEGIIIRVKAADISELKRSAQGVKIMRVEEDEHIVSMARVIPEEDEEEEGAEASDSPADPEE
uniref:DNA gyrase C-terminal beta-propeller domain-containing protein n=1 Tax=uncultured Eubacterium sp. TaxID=165185 RepID=UPI002598BCF8